MWNPTPALSRPLGHRARFALAVALGVAAFVAGLTELRDPDTFHLLAQGREVLRHGVFPTEDPFLFPFAGRLARPTSSWLSALVIYLSHLALGDPGPVWLAGFLLGSLLFVLALDAVEAESTVAEALVALVPLLLVVPVLRPRSVARPEMFANVFLAVTLLWLERHEAGRGKRFLLFFPLLTLAWANFHQSALAGVGLVLLYGVVGAAQLGLARLFEWRREWSPRPAALRVGLTAVGLGLVATLANPATTGPVADALAFAGNVLGLPIGAPESLARVLPIMKRAVIELQPVTQAGPQLLRPFLTLAALGTVSFILGFRSTSPREILTAAVTLAMAFSAMRFASLAALVLAPMTARNLAVALARIQGRLSARLAAGARTAVAVTALAASALAIRWTAEGPFPRFGVGFLADRFPVRVAQYLDAVGFAGRMYNTFSFGGYLEWKLDRKVFQDGRGLLRPGDEGPVFVDISERALASLDDKYRFDALVLAFPESRLRFSGGRDLAVPGNPWSLVAFDDGGLLYLRRDGAYAELADRDEYRFARPESGFPADRLADPAFARGFIWETTRSVAESPRCGSCRWRLGLALLFTGERARAEQVLGPDMLGLAEERVRAFEAAR